MINGHNYQEKNVKIRITERLLAFLILFIIYISKVFKQIERQLSKVVSLLFIDDLRFIALEKSVKKICKTLEKFGKIVLKWKEENIITYNTAKTKLVLFFYAP